MDTKARSAKQGHNLRRRNFLELAAMGVTGTWAANIWASENAMPPELAATVAKLEYLTHDGDFINFGRGTPPPHTLPPEKLREVGLHPDTWQLEVVPDSESNAVLEHPLSKEDGTAFDWNALMELAETHAVRYLHVVSCTNGKMPCGMGVWEGVPLRDVLWMVRPKENIRRIVYHGYHNDDPAQMFQASLSIGRVLEDPPGEHPVMLCYKLNGDWLTPKRGGPVRMLVPNSYGNRSIKWLQKILLTNNYQANDTYALKNNDVDSHLKTCARFLSVPDQVKAGHGIPVTGLAQVGMSGLAKVQWCLLPRDAKPDPADPYWTKADWQDTGILPPPKHWGSAIPGGKLPPIPRQFDTSGRPLDWPLRGTIVHWADLITDVPPGDYEIYCRTIDANGIAQPLPRPFRKSGNNMLQKVALTVLG